MPKINKRFVDLISITDKDQVYWDDELKGFGIRIRVSGRKYYIVQTRYNGRQRKYTIGPHGPITCDQARTKALEVLSLLKSGKDPIEDNAKLRRSLTMKQLGEKFLTEYVPLHCKLSTQKEYKRNVELFINPSIGRKKVLEIVRKDIMKLHMEHAHIPYQANRTLGVLSKMFNLAEIWEMRPDYTNPCLHVKKYKEVNRERFLSSEEYKRLGEALLNSEATGSETVSAINAIWLLMMTGCRLGEIQTLKWEYIDFETSEFRLPDSKTGAKVVQVGSAVIERLSKINRKDYNPYVIIGKKLGAYLSDLQHPWRRIRAIANLDDVRLHDLRHSYASSGLLVGEGLTVIGKLLGHSQMQTTERYAHLANDPIKSAAEKISARIFKITT
jgi:integrase